MELIIYCRPRQAILKFANRFPNSNQAAYSSQNNFQLNIFPLCSPYSIAFLLHNPGLPDDQQKKVQN